MLSDTKALICYADGNNGHSLYVKSNGDVVTAPLGFRIGAIVHDSQWKDDDCVILHGESVWINVKTKEVLFIGGDNAEHCSIIKNKKFLVRIAKITGTMVLWHI